MKNTKIKDYYYNPKTNANSSYIYTSDYCQYKVLRDECWAVMNDLITYKLTRIEAHKNICTNY